MCDDLPAPSCSSASSVAMDGGAIAATPVVPVPHNNSSPGTHSSTSLPSKTLSSDSFLANRLSRRSVGDGLKPTAKGTGFNKKKQRIELMG